jgi:hypothetical protein
MRLSDNSIAQLVRVLQLALLTGTDITDNMRLMRFVAEDDLIDLDPDYAETFEAGLKKLADEAERAQNDGAN